MSVLVMSSHLPVRRIVTDKIAKIFSMIPVSWDFFALGFIRILNVENLNCFVRIKGIKLI